MINGKTSSMYLKQNNTVAGTTNTQNNFTGFAIADVTAGEYAIPGNGLVSTAELVTAPSAQSRIVGYGQTPEIYSFFTSLSAKSFLVFIEYPIP
jgi:hypothetical protein